LSYKTGGAERDVLAPIEFKLGGRKLWAVPANADRNHSTGSSIEIDALGMCRVIGSLEIDDKPHIVICANRNPSMSVAGPVVWDTLSEREAQIAMLVSRGKVNKQIAYQLHISEYTVATYMRRIFCKLGVSSRAAMVAQLMEHASGYNAVGKSR
jgi:DNA-binding CsgD family transcriptional regulator